MSRTVNILILGATSYIGGSVLSAFLEREDFKTLNITALVHSAEKAEKLQSLGINAVVGSHSDYPLVEKIAQGNEIIFYMADADSLEAIQALLKGLHKRFEETGKVPILIHKSSAGVGASRGNGYLDENAVIYTDADSKQMAGIPRTQRYRAVDLEIVAADTAGYVKTYIVMSAAVFGISKTKLTELGVQDEHSCVAVSLARVALDRGKASVIGDGSNVWPYISIEDISSLYTKLYESIANDPNTAHGADGYYFAENGEGTALAIASMIGEALFKHGKVSTPDPVPLSQDEVIKYFKATSLVGSTCKCRGIRSRSLGWRATKGTGDILDSIKSDIESFIATGKADLL
ncbi:NAD(P)-binding protein [Cyathus striatus]|nr:NAD(P)-binding protein [Cyathus striatus]